MTQDASLRSAIESADLVASADRETIYVTLLAIFVLTEGFSELEAEWTLLVGKSKAWLRSQGITSPAKLLNRITLQLA